MRTSTLFNNQVLKWHCTERKSMTNKLEILDNLFRNYTRVSFQVLVQSHLQEECVYTDCTMRFVHIFFIKLYCPLYIHVGFVL